MSTSEPAEKRRWPCGLLAIVLALIDLFMVFVFIEEAVDTTDLGDMTGALILTGLLIALLSWLTFVCVRAFSGGQSGAVPVAIATPTELPGAPLRRRIGGAILATVFFGIALVIGGTELAGLSHGGVSGGGVLGAAACTAVGALGVSIFRTPSAAARAQALGAMNRAAQDAATRQAGPVVGWADDPPEARVATTPSWVRSPVDRTVTYRESLSDVPWPLMTAGVVAGVILLWAITRIGLTGWVVPVAITFATIVLLLITGAMFIPYGIRLSGGVLRLGVQGWPSMGRIWKHQDIPLEEVLAWTVCRRARGMTPIPRSPFPDGDLRKDPPRNQWTNWGNFTAPGVRSILVVRVDPTRVPAAMPALVMMGYAVQATAQTSSDLGVYLIGTRHAQRLVQTLDKAMPSRRSLT